MNSPPPNFNFSKKNSTPNFKKVKFDKSVDIQQLELKEQKEHQKRFQEFLDEKIMMEKMEQFKIDEMYREKNGVPFGGGKFDSPIPMDPFQANLNGSGFGNIPFQSNKQTMDFETFNASLASPTSTSNFSSSKLFNSSKTRISSTYKMQSTNFKNSRFNGNLGHASNNRFSSSKSFNNSKSNIPFKVQSSHNFNSSRSSNAFQNSFKNSNNSNNRSNFGDSYKTSLCFKFKEFQQCENGNQCKFAHGIDELRFPPVYPQPKMCKFFQQNLQCPYGNTCKFLHQYI